MKRMGLSGALAGLLLLGVMLVGLLAPLSGYDAIADVDPTRADLGPSAQHWLGTDHLGRDTASRLLLACRSFTGPGLLACLLAAIIGVPAGAIAGYTGGWTAGVVRFGFTVVGSIPRFVLFLLALSIYGSSMWVLAIVAGIAFVPSLGEAVYGRIEELRRADYVVANQAYGVPPWRILWVHLVWAVCRRPIAQKLITLFGYFLVLETTLSYLRVGVSEPTPSWGNMLMFDWGRSINVWNVAAPALALWMTVGATARLAEATARSEP